MSDFAMYFHGGSGNRGCEAIVRSTSAMLKKFYPASSVSLYSMSIEQDLDALIEDISSIYEVTSDESKLEKPLTTVDRLKIRLLMRSSQKKADEYYFSHFYKELPLKEDKLFLSVGGDNYCYGENSNMNAFNAMLKSLGKKTVLWGCSLDNDVFTEYNTADLQTYDAIFARETSTMELLCEHGFKNKAHLFHDPAFTMRADRLPLPKGFVEEHTIGINVSPLIFKYESGGNRGIGIKAYERLIEYIVESTDFQIALIPHVFWKSSNDLEPLQYLFDKFSATGRVVFINEQLSAPQIKGYIARCKAFIGARTHSTIAAYSSCVPTYVLGYSMKSVGIAKDLFGTSDGYVLPVSKLSDEFALAKGMERILADSETIEDSLQKVMPEYVQNAYDAAKKLAEIGEF